MNWPRTEDPALSLRTIPSNLLQIPNTESNSQYLRYCKAAGVTGHPARFPARLPEFFVQFLTSPNDLVVDIFAGSNTTGAVCEQLNRRSISFDLDQECLAASVFRFVDLSEVEAAALYGRLSTGTSADHQVPSALGLQQALMIANPPARVIASLKREPMRSPRRLDQLTDSMTLFSRAPRTEDPTFASCNRLYDCQRGALWR